MCYYLPGGIHPQLQMKHLNHLTILIAMLLLEATNINVQMKFFFHVNGENIHPMDPVALIFCMPYYI